MSLRGEPNQPGKFPPTSGPGPVSEPRPASASPRHGQPGFCSCFRDTRWASGAGPGAGSREGRARSRAPRLAESKGLVRSERHSCWRGRGPFGSPGSQLSAPSVPAREVARSQPARVAPGLGPRLGPVARATVCPGPFRSNKRSAGDQRPREGRPLPQGQEQSPDSHLVCQPRGTPPALVRRRSSGRRFGAGPGGPSDAESPLAPLAMRSAGGAPPPGGSPKAPSTGTDGAPLGGGAKCCLRSSLGGVHKAAGVPAWGLGGIPCTGSPVLSGGSWPRE